MQPFFYHSNTIMNKCIGFMVPLLRFPSLESIKLDKEENENKEQTNWSFNKMEKNNGNSDIKYFSLIWSFYLWKKNIYILPLFRWGMDYHLCLPLPVPREIKKKHILPWENSM